MAGDFAKYARQSALPGFGPGGQTRLAEAAVAVIGAGGVASAALPLLAGAGFGMISIADCDTVSASNLHRQTLYLASETGLLKAELAKARLALINPDTKVRAFAEKLTGENAAEILAGASICIDATDSFASRRAVSAACRLAGVPEIMASAQGYEAQNAHFANGTGFEEFAGSDEQPGDSEPRGVPIFGPAAHLSGVWAAAAAISFAASGSGFEPGMFQMQNLATGRFFRANFAS